MPPQVQNARIVFLGTAARGHASRAGGQSIIRWACNPPPSVRQTLAALAKLKGPVYAASIIGGVSKRGRGRRAERVSA
jgi:hypothetical protein